MSDSISRRSFLQDAAAVSTGVAAAGELTGNADANAQQGDTRNRVATLASNWNNQFDRVWLGPEYWANPLQDWRLANGRIECTKAAPNRNVHLLARHVGKSTSEVRMSVRIGRVEGERLDAGKGSAGFRIGVIGPLKAASEQVRNSCVFGQGIDAGFTSDGRLFIGHPKNSVPIDLARASIELRVAFRMQEGQPSAIELSAHDADGAQLAAVRRENVPAEILLGNLVLVANYAYGITGPNAARKNVSNKGDAESVNLGAGEFWFADWNVCTGGDAGFSHNFGPILFNHYSLNQSLLKMTAQMPPLGLNDSQTVRLSFLNERDIWVKLAEETIHPQARTATFRIPSWNRDKAHVYRLEYTMLYKDGSQAPFEYRGVISADPFDEPELIVADISCNIHEAFPNQHYVDNVDKLGPHLLAFVGDQFYESTGGYGVQREPLDMAVLDYLRKWYMHGWTWRDLTRHTPSISIPDDHDVYQGNIWGESGAPQKGTQERGGYNMPAEWVNVVHRTQTSHHPDPWDATPCKQGISVYSGPLTYGGVSFAILADRQFKSAPEGNVPPTGGRGDHVTDPDFDPKTADLPGLQLLGPDQMKHLRAWVTDWNGAEMKAVISQTIFTAMATTHGNPNGRLVADYDTNGWPQSERHAALREMRKAQAFHIAGDQHLPAVVHYGIDAHRDAGVAFAGPAVNTGYPRWFEPLKPGENRAEGAPENTGDFLDSFGNRMTVLAVAHGSKQPRLTVMEKLHDKASGIGLVKFDKVKRTITIECWPLLADVDGATTQFPGWPVTISAQDNDGRKKAFHLPRLNVPDIAKPVVAVIEEASGELVYCIRLRENNWQPHVYTPGVYTVQVSEPETGKIVEFRGLEAKEVGNDMYAEEIA